MIGFSYSKCVVVEILICLCFSGGCCDATNMRVEESAILGTIRMRVAPKIEEPEQRANFGNPEVLIETG